MREDYHGNSWSYSEIVPDSSRLERPHPTLSLRERDEILIDACVEKRKTCSLPLSSYSDAVLEQQPEHYASKEELTSRVKRTPKSIAFVFAGMVAAVVGVHHGCDRPQEPLKPPQQPAMPPHRAVPRSKEPPKLFIIPENHLRLPKQMPPGPIDWALETNAEGERMVSLTMDGRTFQICVPFLKAIDIHDVRESGDEICLDVTVDSRCTIVIPRSIKRELLTRCSAQNTIVTMDVPYTLRMSPCPTPQGWFECVKSKVQSGIDAVQTTCAHAAIPNPLKVVVREVIVRKDVQQIPAKNMVMMLQPAL